MTRALDDEGPSTRATLSTLPEDELWTLRSELDDLFIDYIEHQRDTRSFRPDDPFVDLYYKVLRFLDGLSLSQRRRLRPLCRAPGSATIGCASCARIRAGSSAAFSTGPTRSSVYQRPSRRPPSISTCSASIPSARPRSRFRARFRPTIVESSSIRPSRRCGASDRVTTLASPRESNRSPRRYRATAWFCCRATHSCKRLPTASRSTANCCWCRSRPTASPSARRSSRLCAPSSPPTLCYWRSPAECSRKEWTTRATCCGASPWSDPACRR